MDKIVIRGLQVYAYHGVNPEEKENGQTFELDITLSVDVRKPGATDNLEDTISYSAVCKRVVAVMQQQSDDLLERVATRVAEMILTEFPAEAVTVRVKKPEAPMSVTVNYVGVEISRTREEVVG